jgi:TRAP-type C4-dicarboxylate transport system substrate-binding protein
MKRRSVLTVALGLLLAAGASPALAQEKLRIALDTNPVHVRNKGVEVFVAELKKRTGNRFAIEVYPSGQLFRDRDVPRALRQDALEMGVPGTWQLDSAEPNAALQTLPMFYGLERDVVYKVMDGKAGDFLNRRFKVKIPGKWMDLGHQHYYSINKPINGYSDLKGIKIRYPGGTANAARATAMGGVALLVPWPDVPLAMSQGVMDAMMTTFESVRSSKLMDSGLKYAFRDKQYFGQYVPMIRESFWKKQPKDVQDAIIESWNIAVAWQRDAAGEAQKSSEDDLKKAGLKVVAPADGDIANMRKILMQGQAELVEKMKMDKDVVEQVMKALRDAGVGY